MEKTRKAVGMLKVLLVAGVLTAIAPGTSTASEFEIVATSFTVDNQLNVSSVSYFAGQATMPASPAAATTFVTPGGVYLDSGTKQYRVWDSNASAWVQIATGTILSTQVGGSGTANTAARWTAAGVLGNSVIQDNGTNASIGQAPTADILSTGGVGTVNFNNSGGVTILGLTVARSGGITTLYEGPGTSVPVARIK